MSVYPDLPTCKSLTQDTTVKRIPVVLEMYSDVVTPIQAVQILSAKSSHCFMLESAEPSQSWGRYTFIGFEPTLELTCNEGVSTVTTDGVSTTYTDHPADIIRRILADNKSYRLENLPPFVGGLVGYFSYDYIKYSEPSLRLDAQDEDGFCDADLMLFDKLLVFDNYRQKLLLIKNIKADKLEANYASAVNELRELQKLLTSPPEQHPKPLQLLSDFVPLFDEDSYCEIVRKAQHHIHEGDIFQAVLSNRFTAEMEGSLFNAYRVLRTTNPSPYMFYFSSDSIEIAGASPETLVKLQDGVLHTFPLAGTRPRGATPAEDLALERELLADEKELAEHDMLVDLGRNDLGRISQIGSVEVTSYRTIERFSHVMHIGSTVRSRIDAQYDALDAVDAILPAGTLSGAPKIRACQLINDLEGNKRGIYGGAIGYLDLTGNMDTCIAIRIAYSRNGKVHVRSGAGIVADSNPKSEYQECINKARAVLSALDQAQEGVTAC